MADEILYPDSEGGWICKHHKAERGHSRYGSNCYRCLESKYRQLQAENRRLKQYIHFVDSGGARKGPKCFEDWSNAIDGLTSKGLIAKGDVR